MKIIKQRKGKDIDKLITFIIIDYYSLSGELSIEDWLEVFYESNDLEEFCKIVKKYKEIINDVNRVGE